MDEQTAAEVRRNAAKISVLRAQSAQPAWWWKVCTEYGEGPCPGRTAGGYKGPFRTHRCYRDTEVGALSNAPYGHRSGQHACECGHEWEPETLREGF